MRSPASGMPCSALRMALSARFEVPPSTLRLGSMHRNSWSARVVVIKVEPNATLRGSVYPPGMRRTTPAMEAEFEQSISVPVVSEADLYGGKLVAALDRQHPRILFDTKLLLDAEGFTDEVRTAFVVYLASRSRPIAEILDPGLKPLQKVYDGEFAGMTRLQVTCRELEDTRTQLINRVQNDHKTVLRLARAMRNNVAPARLAAQLNRLDRFGHGTDL
jgi:hypothetical protein